MNLTPEREPQLQREFAAAASVVVSLWNVNDIAAASVMKAFYKNLQCGLAKDDALRQAKLELLKGQQPDRERGLPRHWTQWHPRS